MSESTQVQSATEKKADRKPKPASAAQRLLTVKQASELLGVPPRSLWDVIASGKLAVIQLPGQKRRVWLDRYDIDRLLVASREVRV
jgi:excisionase family DNA binding protein